MALDLMLLLLLILDFGGDKLSEFILFACMLSKVPILSFLGVASPGC